MPINHIISVIIPLTLILLAYSSISSFDVFALPPDPNYDSSNTCGAWTTNGDLSKRTCCWTERVAGKLPPNNKVNYCQTCTNNTADGTQNCNKPQQQLRASPNGISPEGSILEQPLTRSLEPDAPIKEDGALENSDTESRTSLDSQTEYKQSDDRLIPFVAQDNPSSDEQ
jgi:hypothetical protein